MWLEGGGKKSRFCPIRLSAATLRPRHVYSPPSSIGGDGAAPRLSLLRVLAQQHDNLCHMEATDAPPEPMDVVPAADSPAATDDAPAFERHALVCRCAVSRVIKCL